MRPLVLLTFLVLAVMGAACTSGEPTPTPGLTVVAIGRDLAVDSTRLPLAILLQGDDGPTRVEAESSNLRIRYGVVDSEEYKAAEQVNWYAWPVSGGAYVIEPDFDGAGTWEIRAELERDGTTYTGSTFVSVADKSSSVPIGQPAPPSNSKTGVTPDELHLITSAAEPDPALYAITVADAVQSGRPSVITFSTPAFCQTATCGPQLDVISTLREEFGDRVNFVHVEVWDNPREMLDTGNPSAGRLSPLVDEWGLITEPWTFLVDDEGIVYDKFEAFTTEAQLTAAVQQMLQDV